MPGQPQLSQWERFRKALQSYRDRIIHEKVVASHLGRATSPHPPQAREQSLAKAESMLQQLEDDMGSVDEFEDPSSPKSNQPAVLPNEEEGKGSAALPTTASPPQGPEASAVVVLTANL